MTLFSFYKEIGEGAHLLLRPDPPSCTLGCSAPRLHEGQAVPALGWCPPFHLWTHQLSMSKGLCSCVHPVSSLCAQAPPSCQILPGSALALTSLLAPATALSSSWAWVHCAFEYSCAGQPSVLPSHFLSDPSPSSSIPALLEHCSHPWPDPPPANPGTLHGSLHNLLAGNSSPDFSHEHSLCLPAVFLAISWNHHLLLQTSDP